jgi:hypothetical protein
VSEVRILSGPPAERSHVSQAIVRELQHNTAQRRRSSRTLEALSVALAWHPQHLTAVLTGHTPPGPGDPPLAAEDDVPAQLTAIEHQLRELTERLGELNDNLAAVLEQVSR